MKAKFVNESIGDYLTPVTQDEIKKRLEKETGAELFRKSVRANYLPGVKRALNSFAYSFAITKTVILKNLTHAIDHKYTEIAAYLLDKTKVNKNLTMFLSKAALQNDVEIVKLLINKKANIKHAIKMLKDTSNMSKGLSNRRLNDIEEAIELLKTYK